MKKIRVKIIDSTTLELMEAGEVKDIIDLKDIQNVDLQGIHQAIKDAKDAEYKKLLLEELDREKALMDSQKKLELKELESKMKEEKNETIKSYEEKLLIAKAEAEELRRNKASLLTKKLGEDLEKWCNGQYESYALSGFENCSWEKDNIAIQNEGEAKATKADYIFKVYKDETKKEEDLMISVCCEMKTESPESKTTKKNSDHFKKLDSDREKKNCTYSLLISELEWDDPNYPLITKVSDYTNMYVVRPAYFMTFLSLLKALAVKYQNLLQKRMLEEIELKEKEEILNEFEDFKNTYLDKPLDRLKKRVETILAQATIIQKANSTILTEANNIIVSEIANIKTKIESFNVKKVAHKVAKLNNTNV